MEEVVPDDFIEAIFKLSIKEQYFFNKSSIFTIRKLAELDLNDPKNQEWRDAFTEERIDGMQSVAIKAAATSLLKNANLGDGSKGGFACAYVSQSIRDMIVNEKQYKSPLILFNEYIECSSIKKPLTHPWRTIYSNYKFEVSKHLNKKTPSDLDVYSFLIWRKANSLEGQLDSSIGARAIPCAWLFMPSDCHGNTMEIDKLHATEFITPGLADRYKYPILINLSDLITKHGAAIYRVEDGDKKWIPVSSQSISQLKFNSNLWDSYKEGENFENSVPHCIIVMPDGIIPASCIKVFQTEHSEIVDVFCK